MFKKRKLGSNHWDAIHEKLKGEKREATTASCPASYLLCASSLGGDCCPTDRSCGISSCFATVTSTTTDCQATGYTSCGVVDGGGCCPSGYTCQRNGCIAPTGGSVSSVCAANSFLCPSSLSYGCCRNGLSCGLSTCYETTSTTSVTLTLTITTTNSNSALSTITTVIETDYNPPTPTPDQNPLITPIAKLPAATISTTPSSTPTTSRINVKELGGIVAACVFLLLVLLLATYFILRRLNLTIKLTKAGRDANHPRGSNGFSANDPRFQSIGIDPLQQIPSSRTGSQSHHPRTNQTTPSELSDNNTPGTRQFNVRGARGLSFSPLNWPVSATSRSGNGRGSSGATGAYRSLPSSDGSRHWRNDSDGSQAQSISNPTTTASMNTYVAELQSPDPPQSYFEIPVPKTTSAFTDGNIDPALRDQNLRFGHTASNSQGSDQRPSIDQTRGGGHGRQWSDVSELSNGTETTNESYELDDTSPKSPRSHKYGYNSLHGSGSNTDKRSLREGVKNKVQDWVGMTGLGRKTSRRRDEGFGISFTSGGLGGFKVIPSPTTNSPPASDPTPLTSTNKTQPQTQEQEPWLRNSNNNNTDHHAPLPPPFTRFAEKGKLEAIKEALRESGTTFGTKEEGAGEVSESRAQIARMEIKRVDSDLTPIDRDEVVGKEGGYKDLVV